MKNFTSTSIRSAFAAAFITVTLFTVTGCAPQTASPSPSSGPSVSASETPEATVGCPDASQAVYGDAVASQENTDEHGTYCHITVNPDADALIFDPDMVDPSVEEYGFTMEDAEAAQTAAVTFIVEQTLDSTLLDTYTDADGAADWLDENINLINPYNVDLYRTFVADEGLTAGLMLTDEEFPALRRDGEPRSSNLTVEVIKVYAKELEDGTPYIQVAVDASVTFPVNNSDVVAFSEGIPAEKTTASDNLEATHPFLFEDPNGSSNMVITGIFSAAYLEGNYSQIVGSTTDWDISAIEQN